MTAAASGKLPTDEELAALVARRLDHDGAMSAARAAFEQLYRRHAPALLAFLAARVRRADSEDVHQDVWRRVWVHLPDQFRSGNFRAWLFQIARNAVVDQSRRRKPDPLADPGRLADTRSDAIDQPLIDAEHREALRRCLELLKPKSAALVRARLGGEDYTTLCKRLGINTNAAYRMMNDAKTQLKTCVERAES
jgi:RNA polymerase sigma-70 factor (ECF subfamily)